MKLAVLKKVSVLVASVLMIVAGAPVAHADLSIPMLSVTSDIMPGVAKFVLNTDFQGDMSSLAFFESATSSSPVTFTVPELVRGKVVVEKEGKDAVMLQTEAGFTAKDGGRFRVQYLYNGATGSIRYLLLELVRAGSTWSIYEVNGGTHGSKAITSMWVAGRYLPLTKVVIGIKGIYTR